MSRDPGTANFFTAAAKSLSNTDRWCILYPMIKKLLRADVKEITSAALLDNAREPVRRFLSFELGI